MLGNGVGFPVAWLAIAKLGAVIVPVNPGYRSADLAHVVTDSGAVLALAGSAAAAEALPALDFGEVGLLDPADVAAVTPDDVDLTAQPFYYMDPQWNTVLCLLTGIPLVILPRFSASGFWPSVRDHGVTFFYVLGTMPLLLLKQPPDPELDRAHRVRLVLCSGITPALHAAIEERWGAPWREAYGSTEAGVVLAVRPEDTACVGTGTMGRPVPGKEAKVVREDGSDAADGEVGEIVVRGEPMLTGYWNRDEPLLRDGWYPMGDLGYRDPRGHYHLVGRLKEMIRRGSENIAAAEVEAVLADHPAVRAAAVVPVPDELLGEEVKAFVQDEHRSAGAPRRLGPGGRLRSALVERTAALQDLTRRFIGHPKVIISAVNGIAVGVGVELAIASDLRLAGHAASFAFKEVHRGLFPSNGVLYSLPRLVVIKEAMQRVWELDLEEVLDLETEGLLACLRGRDVLEGVRSFMERRPAVYRGD